MWLDAERLEKQGNVGAAQLKLFAVSLIDRELSDAERIELREAILVASPVTAAAVGAEWRNR